MLYGISYQDFKKNNNPNGIMGMGDRILEIWKKSRILSFPTNNAAQGNVN